MEQVRRAGALELRDVVGDPVATVAPDATLVEVAQQLTSVGVGALAVGAGGEVTGVVSERDIVSAVAEGRDLATTRVIDVAHTDLVWCDADATVAEAAERMMERYIRHILVADGDRPPSIVSARDLLGVYAADDVVEDLGDVEGLDEGEGGD